MSHLLGRVALVVLAVSVPAAAGVAPPPPFPEDHRQLTRTITFAEMESFLRSVDGTGPVHVTIEGTSTAGRALYVVHLSHGGDPRWRVLFYAQQHGDEVAGKNALLFMVRDIARDPSLLPPDVEVWMMPMVNPDGGEALTRRNGAGADLNRDHMTLAQPETAALHRLARRLRPDVAVDCHEFGRDSEDWRARGWLKWPDVTMDGLDNPLFDPAVTVAAARWVEEAGPVCAAAGHPFLRYWVGGAPPDAEQRHSAPDLDGGLNAIGVYGGLSFIIESAVRWNAADPMADLGNRVDAYSVLLWRFVRGDGHRDEDLAAIAGARSRALPAFIPTNYLWVNPGMTVTDFPVFEVASGRRITVPTANMMTAMAVKQSVPAPLGYAVVPAAADEFCALLDRHGIPYEMLAAPRTVRAESCTLLRVEDEFDDVYNRYEGRQIVKREAAAERELPAGAVWVALAGEAAIRAALLLEPTAMYGLYQYPSFRALVGQDGAIPVLRVVR
jgi:hypothetical protein